LSGYVSRNVATLVDAPSASQDEFEPLTFDEALRIFRLAGTRRNGEIVIAFEVRSRQHR
jgi:hypothetical protein